MPEILILKGEDDTVAGQKLQAFLGEHGFDVGEVDEDGDFRIRYEGLTYLFQPRLQTESIDRLVIHLFFRPRPGLPEETIADRLMEMNRKYNVGSFWMDASLDVVGLTTFLTFRDALHVDDVRAFMRWIARVMDQLASELSEIVA